ncbi:MAG: DNA polymerase III subunit beta [Alphaproteobacteria bacterium]|jgi:DNA polymerase-3 subunit beta|nr:DNA polymerase III subunit beta [Alphaproteobacteria bacterium]
MKFTTTKENLLQTLTHLHSVTERKSTIPILCNIKIEAIDGIKMVATNVDLEIVESMDAGIAETGATTVPAHTFFEIARKLPAGEVNIEQQKDSLIITSGKSIFSLPCLDAEDFPIMVTSNMPYKFSLSPDDLIKLIDKTKFAISTEETRYFLNGIFLHSTTEGDKDVLRSVATDGHRLARQDILLPEGAAGLEGIIIPRKVVMELRRLLDDTSEEIKVEISDNKIRFSFGRIVLTSKLIDGKFPDYKKVIPMNNDKVLEVNCEKFYEAVDRVSAVSNEKSKAIKMKAFNDMLTFSANTSDATSGEEELISNYSGEEAMETSFNARYLLDIASQIEGENIKFILADNSSPALVSETSNQDSVYVLMPMRVA